MAYVIEDNKTRTIIYKQLLAYGIKAVQKSVFWGYVSIAEFNSIKRLFDRSLTISDNVFINRVNMHEQKLDYRFVYDDKTF
ncbi:CRISPR-associated endonuclease Cas2, partial [Francisella tularensis]|uniref:CRISPR-associated endonuclease Cas2 n=1 Tax=Francisella tularensis TaxID=263 RepID=UPI002381CFA5|nr:CRISPR-associated endonuclease Cas2 [Francisella tularensis subsp. holarctica]